jgi:hypothetical protein
MSDNNTENAEIDIDDIIDVDEEENEEYDTEEEKRKLLTNYEKLEFCYEIVN